MIVNFISSVKNIYVERQTLVLKNLGLKKYKRINKNFSSIKLSLGINNEDKFSLEFIPKANFGFLIYSIVFIPNVVFAVPDENPGQKVLDESGVLTKSSISYIEKSLTKVKEATNTEVYFVSVRNLPYGKEPQEYAKELFEKWKLGEKDVIVVLVNKLAKAGIYYGNQVNQITDEIAQSIGNETYPFKAKNEQYSSAALDVNNRLVSILLEKGDPGAPSVNRGASVSNFKSAKKTEESRSKYIAIIAILLIIAFVVPMVQFFYYVKDE